jgi:hypothetical protein
MADPLLAGDGLIRAATQQAALAHGVSGQATQRGRGRNPAAPGS